jgi:hypothetical protein
MLLARVLPFPATVPYAPGVSTLQEIKAAIAGLNEHDKALLAAELFAEQDPVPDATRLAVSLERGLQDVEAGRVRPLEEARALISEWTTKS